MASRISEFTFHVLTNKSSDVLAESCQLNSMSVVYILFLEVAKGVTLGKKSFMERIINKAIRHFTPTPSIAHCELLVPPTGINKGRNHFATYLGSAGAHWQNREGPEEGRSYYLVVAGGRWRAITVYAHNLCEHTLRACETMKGAPYSLRMYLTSVPPFRSIAHHIFNDSPTHEGHCATITARVLQQSGVKLKHHPQWYSPGSLYAELNRTTVREKVTSTTGSVCTDSINQLLLSPMSTHIVELLGDRKCSDAVNELARLSLSLHDSDDNTAQSQRDLARGLLAWVLLRQP